MKFKQYWEFTKWHMRGWTPGQKLWLVACFLFGVSMAEPDPQIALYIFCVGATILAGLFFKFVVFEIIAAEYARFKKERTDLFQTIDKGE